MRFKVYQVTKVRGAWMAVLFTQTVDKDVADVALKAALDVVPRRVE